MNWDKSCCFTATKELPCPYNSQYIKTDLHLSVKLSLLLAPLTGYFTSKVLQNVQDATLYNLAEMLL